MPKWGREMERDGVSCGGALVYIGALEISGDYKILITVFALNLNLNGALNCFLLDK